MKRRGNVIDSAAEQLVNIDNANYADERERSVYLEAQAFGMQLSFLMCWLGALVVAATGHVGASLALIVAPVVPALGAQWFAARRGVSTYRILARGPLTKTLGWVCIQALLLFGTCAALVYRAYYGQGLWHMTVTFEVVGEELQNALTVGAILGLGLAAPLTVIIVLGIIISQRRQDIREMESGEADDHQSGLATITRSRLVPATGVFVAVLSVVSLIIAEADGFTILLAVAGVLYGAVLVGFHKKSRTTY